MSLILKQETPSSIPAPPSGKTTIFVDLTGTVSSVASNGAIQQFPTVGGSNTQILYNNQGSIAGDANLTYIASTGTLSAKNLSVTGTLTAGNIAVNSLADGTSNVVVALNGNVSTSVAGNANILVVTGTGANITGTLSASGNANVGNIGLAGVYATSLSATANANVGNIGSAGLITAIGNIQGANLVTTGVISATGNVTGGNINTVGLVSATGNIQSAALVIGANLSITGNANIGNIGTPGQVTAIGNVTGSNINAGGLISATGNVIAGNLVTPGVLSVTGYANVGNLLSSGIVSAAGNVIANSKLLVGVNSTTLINPVAVFTGLGASYAQLSMQNLAGVGSADIVTYGNNGDDTQSWTDMGFTGNTFNDANYTITAPGDGYLFVQGNTSFGGNMVIATGNIGTTKDIIFGTGGFLTGNIKARLYNSNGTFSVTGNVTGGNITTGGLITATGNITGGNITTAGLISATGNVTGGNLSASGNVDAVNIHANAGTITAGSFFTPSNANSGAVYTGTLSATGNANIGNIGTAGLITATGNIQGGNLVTAGSLSVTGNANVGNVGVSGLVTVSGNVAAANIVTPNVITSGSLSLTASSGNINLSATSGNIILNNINIRELATPVNAYDAATKAYVDNSVAAGLDIHNPVVDDADTNLAATYANGGTTPTWTTITTANTIATGSAHGLSVNDVIVFGSTTNGITAGTPYFVFSVPTTTTITLSLTYNGEQITTLTNGTGLSITSLANPGVGATLTSTGTGPLSIEGYTAALNDRILVLGQTDARQNGIYYITQVGVVSSTPWILTRATDANKYIPNSANGLDQGAYTYVTGGGDAGEAYVCNTVGTIVFGTTNITWAQFSQVNPYVAGTGLTLTGLTFSVNASQTQVTAVGTLTSLSVSGNANIGNVGATTFVGNLSGTTSSVSGNANVGNIGVTGGVFAATLSATGNANVGNIGATNIVGTLTTAAQTNITSVGTLTGLGVTGTITAVNITANTGVFTGNANGISSVQAANIVGTTLSSTVVSSSLTAVGTLASLSVTANANIGNIGTGGLITATGNITGSNIISTTNHLFSVATGISAAGTVQANATAITKDFNVVSTVASGAGVVFPSAVAGMRFTVINTSANALLVYPAGSGIINSQAASAAYSQPAGARLDYIATSTSQWYTLNATYG